MQLCGKKLPPVHDRGLPVGKLWQQSIMKNSLSLADTKFERAFLQASCGVLRKLDRRAQAPNHLSDSQFHAIIQAIFNCRGGRG